MMVEMEAYARFDAFVPPDAGHGSPTTAASVLAKPSL